MSDSLWPHGPQHARPPCPSPTPGIYPNSCPSSRWCCPTTSSSVVPFPCLQSFPASGSFPISHISSNPLLNSCTCTAPWPTEDAQKAVWAAATGFSSSLIPRTAWAHLQPSTRTCRNLACPRLPLPPSPGFTFTAKAPHPEVWVYHSLALRENLISYKGTWLKSFRSFVKGGMLKKRKSSCFICMYFPTRCFRRMGSQQPHGRDLVQQKWPGLWKQTAGLKQCHAVLGKCCIICLVPHSITPIS